MRTVLISRAWYWYCPGCGGRHISQGEQSMDHDGDLNGYTMPPGMVYCADCAEVFEAIDPEE